MPRDEAPNIHAGEQLPYTKRPFLGKLRINKVIAVINAFLRLKIKRGNEDAFFLSAKGATIQIKDESAQQGSSAVFFPFKIYQVPSGTDSDWRKVRVRAGRINDKVLTGSGCDGYDTNPDELVFPACTDITVPAGQTAYYLWIEISGSNYVLNHGTPPGSWATFPISDKGHKRIGFVDTVTRAADQKAVIRQFLRADIDGIETDLCDPLTNENTTVIIPAIKKAEEP